MPTPTESCVVIARTRGEGIRSPEGESLKGGGENPSPGFLGHVMGNVVKRPSGRLSTQSDFEKAEE